MNTKICKGSYLYITLMISIIANTIFILNERHSKKPMYMPNFINYKITTLKALIVFLKHKLKTPILYNKFLNMWDKNSIFTSYSYKSLFIFKTQSLTYKYQDY